MRQMIRRGLLYGLAVGALIAVPLVACQTAKDDAASAYHHVIDGGKIVVKDGAKVVYTIDRAVCDALPQGGN